MNFTHSEDIIELSSRQTNVNRSWGKCTGLEAKKGKVQRRQERKWDAVSLTGGDI